MGVGNCLVLEQPTAQAPVNETLLPGAGSRPLAGLSGAVRWRSLCPSPDGSWQPWASGSVAELFMDQAP